MGVPILELKNIKKSFATVQVLKGIDLLVKEGDKKPIIMNIADDAMELKINSFIKKFHCFLRLF